MGKWEGFKMFFYNKERGEVMGRSGSSWAQIGLFYLIFYAALAAFFAVMLVIFYQTLNHFEPRWTLDSSLIGTNPGLGFRPMPDDDNVESTLIWFQHGSTGNWNPWVNRLQDFLSKYEEGQQYGQTIQQCDWQSPPKKDKVCYFDIKLLGNNCTKERNFGYDQGHPCVLIKLNRIFDWVPVTYNGTDVPDNMPDQLKNLIRESRPDQSMIWLSCEGENPADRENLGPVVYTPQQGFPAYYYPFKNTPNYLSPIVMVQLLKPVPGVLINIECKAWAQNIEHSRMERRGSVHFELLMD